MKSREQKIEAFARITSQVTIDNFKKEGHPFMPMLHILYAEDQEENNTQVTVIQLPEQIMSTADSKDELIEMMVPAVVEGFRRSNKHIICLAVASDAFVSSHEVPDGDPEKMRELSASELIDRHQNAKKETAVVLMFYTSSKQFSECYVYKTEGGRVEVLRRLTIKQIDNRSRFSHLLKPNPRDN